MSENFLNIDFNDASIFTPQKVIFTSDFLSHSQSDTLPLVLGLSEILMFFGHPGDEVNAVEPFSSREIWINDFAKNLKKMIEISEYTPFCKSNYPWMSTCDSDVTWTFDIENDFRNNIEIINSTVGKECTPTLIPWSTSSRRNRGVLRLINKDNSFEYMRIVLDHGKARFYFAPILTLKRITTFKSATNPKVKITKKSKTSFGFDLGISCYSYCEFDRLFIGEGSESPHVYGKIGDSLMLAQLVAITSWLYFGQSLTLSEALDGIYSCHFDEDVNKACQNILKIMFVQSSGLNIERVDSSNGLIDFGPWDNDLDGIANKKAHECFARAVCNEFDNGDNEFLKTVAGMNLYLASERADRPWDYINTYPIKIITNPYYQVMRMTIGAESEDFLNSACRKDNASFCNCEICKYYSDDLDRLTFISYIPTKEDCDFDNFLDECSITDVSGSVRFIGQASFIDDDSDQFKTLVYNTFVKFASANGFGFKAKKIKDKIFQIEFNESIKGEYDDFIYDF